MNDLNPSFPSGPISRENIRQKADILETNLFKSLSKQNDPVVLRFQINRETRPVPVIIKALINLLPRLNIRAPKVLLTIKTLLDKTIEAGKELKVKKNILDLSQAGEADMSHLTISLRVVASSKALAVEIRGTAPVPGQDGAIKEAFFDHKSCPGLIKKDGAMDFKEINKYPIVKKGDNLFFISLPVKGQTGIQFDGTIIPVEKSVPMDISLREGVCRIEKLDDQGNSEGYYLCAQKTGVVVLTRPQGQITDIEVRDALDIQRLDYATGNIGTRFICPISMNIDTICNGFKIRAKGDVTVRELDGGEIHTDHSAFAQLVQPDSKITAANDITVNFSRKAYLSSANGKVTINDEMSDTCADGKIIAFEKHRGILSGNTLDAQTISLINIYFNGKNQIHFGRRLFMEKQELVAAREALKDKIHAKETESSEIMPDLNKEIRLLSKILKTHLLLKDNLKGFILAVPEMDYPVLYRELDVIAQSMNTREVIQIKKYLDRLRQIPEEIDQCLAESTDMAQRMAGIEREMGAMTLEIDGFLRRAATIQIFTPETEDPAPALVVESKTDHDTRVIIQGRYSSGQGFEVIRIPPGLAGRKRL